MNANIVFFDTGVEQYPALAEGLPAGIERVVLDHRLDGLEQIGRHLQGRTDVAAIYIVCHGSPGALCLGRAVVDAQALASNRAWLRSIGQSLAPGGDIVLYGCHVAVGETGRAFITELAALTGADVAAASGAIGAQARGGVAVPDVYVGAVRAPALFTQAGLDRLDVRLGSTPANRVPGGDFLTVEFNGSFTTARWTTRPSITNITEVDYFQFVPQVSGSYVISTVSTSGLDPKMRLYRADGQATTPEYDDTGNSGTERITADMVAGQLYGIAVTGFAATTGNYDVTVQGPAPVLRPFSAFAPQFTASFPGQILFGQEIDYFRLTPPAGTNKLSLRLTPTGFDSAFFLKKESGEVVAAVTNNAVGAVDSLLNFAVTPGESLILEVSAATATGTGSYALAIDYDPDNFGDPPASVTPGTGELHVLNPFGNAQVNGKIETATDNKLYAFFIDTPGQHTMSVRGASLDTQFRLYQESGAAGGPLLDSLGANVAETTVQDFGGARGWIYLAVAGRGSETGDFTLTVDSPNAAAPRLPTPSPTYRGEVAAGISRGGETDYYTITAPLGVNSLVVTMLPPVGLSAAVRLYDANGGLASNLIRSGATAGALETSASVAVTGGSSYFLGVSSNLERTSFGNYRLTVDFNPDASTVPTANDDFLTGTAGADNIVALAGSDTINAQGGDDNIDGGPGADRIDGGPGTDTSLYSGVRSSYVMSKDSRGTVTVADKLGVMDTLSNVEFLSFGGDRVPVSTLGPLPQASIPLTTEVNANTIYRFYNTLTKAYFYAPTAAERDQVISRSTVLGVEPSGPLSFFYQGTTFDQVPAGGGGATVYRFFNTATNHHFYTIKPEERDYVLKQSTDASFTPNEPLWPFNPELNSGFSAFTSGGAGRDPVFRFYSPTLDRHFFTASVEEAQEIRLTGVWTDEGIGFYVPS